MNNLLKNKKISIPIFIFVIFSILMIIIAAIYNIANHRESANINKETIGKAKSFIDPISGETIQESEGIDLDDGRVVFVGFYNFIKQGMSSDEMHDIQDIFTTKKDTFKIRRVTLYKDSYKQDAQDKKTFTAKISINQGQKDIFIKIVNKTYLQHQITLYEDAGMTKEIN